jgi:hypothetical protein
MAGGGSGDRQTLVEVRSHVRLREVAIQESASQEISKW